MHVCRVLWVPSTNFRFLQLLQDILPFRQYVPATSASFFFISGCQRMVWAATWEHTTMDSVYQHRKFPHPFQPSTSRKEDSEKCGVLSKQLLLCVPWTDFLLPVSDSFKWWQKSLCSLLMVHLLPVEIYCKQYGWYIISRITSPLLLIAVAASFGACYILSVKNEEWKITVFAYELTLAQQYGLVAVCSLPLFYLAGAGAAIFWVLGKIVFHVSYNKRL